jgi:hypothetical protein
MTLHQGKDYVSAKWNAVTGAWDIGEKEKFCWLSNEIKPTQMSEWFYELEEALEWIKDYDKKQRTI